MKATKFNYYKEELSKLKRSEYFTTIQFRDNQGNYTKNMNLNKDSIPVFINYLQEELNSMI